jgi:stage III sporulation protein AH
MPNDLLSKAVSTEEKENKKEKVEETVEEISSLTAMRVSLEEERQGMMADLQEQLTSDTISSEEKNNAYEQLKYLNTLQSKEEELEKQLKKEFKLDSFVKIDNTNISVVCVSSKHDNALANDIMRLIQSGYENKMYITVKFQKA